jgi:CBS domain-containing protein
MRTEPRATVGEWLRSRRATAGRDRLEWLAQLLRTEGVDLSRVSAFHLRRGTPVYVEAGADVVEVQRLMAANHIRSLPVLDRGRVSGFVDLVDLALSDFRSSLG